MFQKDIFARESMASRLRESTARVYFSVCLSPAWPRIEATVLMLAPLLSRLTANECLAQCLQAHGVGR